VIDQVSGALTNQTMRATRILGRIVNVGRLGGMRADFDLDLHALRRKSYIGVTFRTRSVAEVAEINARMRTDLEAELAAGRIGLPVDRVFAFDDAAAALEHMRANRHFGKLILQL
jgi:NADPH2:quinone reductase